VRVALVGGVDGHRGVAEHGLGPRGGHDDVVGVADRDQLALVLAVLHLDVRQGGQAARAPVDDALGAVDQPFVEELLEHRLDGSGEPLVHGEALAVPVDAVAELAHLPEDLAAGLLLPLPDPLDERLAAQVMAGLAGLGQLAFDDVLGGDAGVVHAGQPQRLVPQHAGPAGERVLDGVVERVPDVQDTGDVRRGQDDAVRHARAARISAEVAFGHPSLVATGLDVGRGVLGRQLWRCHSDQF
jgi:hypothetical protein